MRVAVYLNPEKKRDKEILDALVHGLDVSTLFVNPTTERDLDLAILFGIKSNKYATVAKNYIVLDKGYERRTTHGRYRVSINSHNPNSYQLTRTTVALSRVQEAGWLKFRPWRKSGRHILIAGSSGKFHKAHGSDRDQWLEDVVGMLYQDTRRPIVYRPKPSDKDVPEIKHVLRSRNKDIAKDLKGAHCLITYGSNAVFEAMRLGIPQIVLGPAITHHLSSNSLSELENPHLATETQRMTFFANLAWHDWHISEIANGTTWRWLKSQL